MPHVLACPPYPVAKLGKLIPEKLRNHLEYNQKAALCCRHVDEHEISAWYSSENWRDKKDHLGNPEPRGGVPDVYKFHCTCGRTHPIFMVGGGDVRPFWDVR